MKKQIKKMLLPILLLSGISLHTVVDTAAAPASMTEAKGAPANQMAMPSVADVFGGMSQEEIVQQVQEAQKFFESLSPEEVAELEKMVSQTLETMSPEDLADIQGIAQMVEPHLEFQDEAKGSAKTPEAKTAPKEEENKKDKSDVIDTNDIKSVLKGITRNIDEIFQKAEGSKSATEEIKHKWSSKVTFDNMKRQITALSEDRLLKKLAKPDSKEEKDLVEKLRNLQKDLAKANDSYKIEDTFGVPSSSSVEVKNLKKTQEMLSVFESHIDEVMPTMEKFLRKHDPEALAMAKESEERAKKATMHEKDSELKRGSLPAQPSMSGPGMMPGGSLPTYGSPGGSMGGYGSPGMGGYGYPSDDLRQRSGAKSSPDTATTSPQAPTAKDKQGDKSKDNNQQQKKESTLDGIIDSLKDHKEVYDSKHVNKFNDFLRNQFGLYPDANLHPTMSANPTEQDDWIHSKGAYKGQGFEDYTKKVLQLTDPFEGELNEMHDLFDDAIAKVQNLTGEEASKLHGHKAISDLASRVENYKDTYEKVVRSIEDIFEENAKTPQKGKASVPLSSTAHAQAYENIHIPFMNKLHQKIAEPIASLQLKIDKLKRKAKSRQRNAKTAKTNL